MSNNELGTEEDAVSTLERGDELLGPKTTDDTTTWRVVLPSDQINGEAFVWLEAESGGDRWIGHEELEHLLKSGEWEVLIE